MELIAVIHRLYFGLLPPCKWTREAADDAPDEDAGDAASTLLWRLRPVEELVGGFLFRGVSQDALYVWHLALFGEGAGDEGAGDE